MKGKKKRTSPKARLKRNEPDIAAEAKLKPSTHFHFTYFTKFLIQYSNLLTQSNQSNPKERRKKKKKRKNKNVNKT